MKRVLLSLSAVLACGCGSSGLDAADAIGPLTPRAGTAVVEGCTLDDTQRSALTADGGARRVFKDVILRCLAGDVHGGVSPSDADGIAALQQTIDWLRGAGFRARLGFKIVDASGNDADPDTASYVVGDPTARAQVVSALTALPLSYDGLEIALPPLTNGSRDALTAFVRALAPVRAKRPLGIFVPPSVMVPSDIAGGDAYDITALAPLVDRVRVMTLDFSCCGAGPGPTIDSGWAVDAARLAIDERATALDVAVPLYGNDFGPTSTDAISFSEAHDLATYYRASITREDSGALHFAYSDRVKGDHEVWFDDVISTARTLEAWQPQALQPSVGVVYYGLGAEDPALWLSLGRALP